MLTVHQQASVLEVARPLEQVLMWMVVPLEVLLLKLRCHLPTRPEALATTDLCACMCMHVR